MSTSRYGLTVVFRTILPGLLFVPLTVWTDASEAARNVVLVLSDDHRHDFMRFHPDSPEWLETPAMDRMAREGVHFANAFVSTSLCSPSRASILTGRYMHHHRVVDNQRPVPPGTSFFPQILQAAGCQTAFIGKWHMGHEENSPRPGFDYWASFKGQGVYFDPKLNINGKMREFAGYNADVLTDLTLDWLETARDRERPFFLFLSYKAVHYPFQPAERHRGCYADRPVDYPETMARTERNYRTQPRWVRERRYSIHGIDHMETGPFDKDPVPCLDKLYRSYAEAVHSLDENLGRLLDYLSASGLAGETVVIYMSDNGFHLGEHGFYDKRDAFETSIRIPLLAWAPGQLKQGMVVKEMVQNIDIAPTILSVLGVEAPKAMRFDGRSFLPLLRGEKDVHWRDHILYEYHWEWNFPATPTLYAIRTERYKYVYYHGVWDVDSFHDLASDPLERHNLINIPAYQKEIAELRARLFRELGESSGLRLPIRVPYGERLDQRKLPP
ncbi:MAG: sulfatase [Pirellulales bacterium]|nr:sulfatase [Pirellulales bacterium]